ncbi:MAG: hypothetical protein ACFFD4_18980 [Candidatus Odinarchaeota archaeon]
MTTARNRGPWIMLYLLVDSDYTGKGNTDVFCRSSNTCNNIYAFRMGTVLLEVSVAAMN